MPKEAGNHLFCYHFISYLVVLAPSCFKSIGQLVKIVVQQEPPNAFGVESTTVA
jgi:hypothetical protein